MNDKFKGNSDNPLDKFFDDDSIELEKDLIKDDNVEELNKIVPTKWKDIKKSRKNLNKDIKSRDKIGTDKWKDVDKARKKSKTNSSNKIIFISILVLFICILITFFYLFSIKYEIFSKGSLGVKAVNLLYDFSSVNELEDNLNDLSNIMTEEVYKKVSVTNSDKALNTYLKFKKNPVSVTIMDSKPGFILYTLDSSSLSSGRKFIFSYTVDWRGRIDSVREMEGIDFYKE